MGKSREIKKRMKAVGNIKRITRTMQMIATAKFSAAQQRATAAQPYSEALFGLVQDLASAGSEMDHPLLSGSVTPDAPEVTLIMTSDRGLCGPYNGSVIRTALRFLRENERAVAGRLELVGKKGVAGLRFNGFTPDTHHVQFGDKPEYADVERLAQVYIDQFSAGEISRVRLVSMRYHSVGRQSPEISQLLPLRSEDDSGAGADTGAADAGAQYEFSPKGPELLATLLPAAIKARLFQAFNESVLSEHIARMVAMKAASDNASKMGKRLTREYNRARQAQITTELTEIISGAAALE